MHPTWQALTIAAVILALHYLALSIKQQQYQFSSKHFAIDMVLLLIFYLALTRGPTAYASLMSLVTGIISLELFRALFNHGKYQFPSCGLTSTAMFMAIPWVFVFFMMKIHIFYVFLCLCLVGINSWVFYHEARQSFMIIASVFILAVLLAINHITYMSTLTHGVPWCLLMVISVNYNNSAHLVFDRILGRHPLSVLSQNKTFEGSMLTLLGNTLQFTLLCHILAMPVTGIHALFLGLFIAVFMQLGSLFTSLLRRITGIDEFSLLLPDRAGLMDRVGSLMFAAPFMVYSMLA